MTEIWQQAKQLFHEVLSADAEARDRLLDAADPRVRDEVLGLLRAHDEAEPVPAEEGPGTVIGRYTLLQEIGQGGFGVVFMAEQREPVRRKVALKIIKLGMDTRQVVARFEAERQALALMDHPGIAHVFDAGNTDTGRPYFVMELVKGIPITKYCDQAGLDTRERLDLFQQVCHAVQHAHQKGVIHRDLKPSNVLVTLHDGRPVPKVIDFGVAKATEHRLTERTLFTEFRQMIGTPEYMPPEQAELSGLDVDTRADVYSLGVLLYELLTGTLPFEVASLMAKGYDEVVRTIREVDPPKPSTRVSTMGNPALAIARSRGTTDHLLTRQLRGDLDWIVMKALEKDRSRRYESASAFAADIGRHLTSQPVLAGAPGAWYRARKYVRRHRFGVAAAAAVVVALAVGLVFASLAYRDAEEARQREVVQRQVAEQKAVEASVEAGRAGAVRDLIVKMLSGGTPFERGPGYTVRALLDDFDRQLEDQPVAQPEVEVFLRITMARAFLALAEPVRAEDHLRRARALIRESGLEGVSLEHQLQHAEVQVLAQREEYDLAIPLYRRLLADYCERESKEEWCKRIHTLCHLTTALARQFRVQEAREVVKEAEELAAGSDDAMLALAVKNGLAEIDMAAEDFVAAERRLRELIQERRRLGLPADPAYAQKLAVPLMALGRYEEAESECRQAIEEHRALLGEESAALAYDYNALAVILAHKGDLDGARELAERSLDLFRRLGRKKLHDPLAVLCIVANEQGDHEAAVRWAREGLQYAITVFGKDHPHTAAAYSNLAMALAPTGEVVETEQCLRHAVEIARRTDGYFQYGEILFNLSKHLSGRSEFAESEALAREGLVRVRQQYGDRHPSLVHGLHALGLSLREKDPPEAARTLREALEIARELMPEHISRAWICWDLANLLRVQEDLQERVDLLRESVLVADSVLGPASPLVPGQLQSLLEAAVSAGRPEAAEWAARRLLVREESARPRWLAALVRALLAQDRFEDSESLAREYFELALADGSSARRIDALDLLGTALSGLGETDEAEALLLEAHGLLEQTAWPSWPRDIASPDSLRAEIRGSLVELYRRIDEPEEVAFWSGHDG